MFAILACSFDDSRMKNTRQNIRRSVLLTSLFLLAAAWGPGLSIAQSQPVQKLKAGESLPKSPAYEAVVKKIDGLVKEQKLQAALDVANSESSKITDPIDQARLMTKVVQLESGLHAYETAVNNFRTKKWPADLRAQALLNIFYAHSLQQYAQSYSWEIRQRTKVATSAKKDLKAWTVEEIYNDAGVGLALTRRAGKTSKDCAQRLHQSEFLSAGSARFFPRNLHLAFRSPAK